MSADTYLQQLIDESIDPTPNTSRIRPLKAKAMRLMMLPIYSKSQGVWQMDTFEQSDTIKELKKIKELGTRSTNLQRMQQLKADIKDYPPYFLILININTRKAYAYAMETKSESAVLQCLKDFILKETVSEFFTDDDSAYKGKEINQWYDKNRIRHVHTTKDNKHTLGIINRFIRTIRDGVGTRNMTDARMQRFIDKYNETQHKTTHKKPNAMTTDEEKQYIMDQYQKEQAVKAVSMLDTSMKARRYIDRAVFMKRRIDFDPVEYPITALKGKIYQIKQGKNTVNVPRWKLRVDKGIKQHEGEPVKILNYNEDYNMYEVEFENNDIGYIGFKQLRGNELYKLHPLEREYWKDKPRDSAPKAVKSLLPRIRIKLVVKRN